MWDDLIDEVLKLEGPMRSAFMEAVWGLRDQVDRDRLLLLLQQGRVAEAINLVFPDGPAWTAPLVARMTSALQSSKVFMFSRLQARVGDRAANLFVVTGPRASVDRASEAIGRRIVEIHDTTRDAVRAMIERQVNEGRNPRSVIVELAGRVHGDGSRSGGIIGLTQRQAMAVMNYRRALEDRSRDALARALRDRRFDPSVRNNAARLPDGSINPNFKALTEGQIDELVRRYEARMLAHRAEVIARTESARMQHEAQMSGWEDSVAAGRVRREHLSKTWSTARDEKVRAAHRLMDGVTVGFDDYFQTDDLGPVLYPQAPNCRCLVWIQPDLRRTQGDNQG